jgi:hypothetical protein
MKLLTKDVFVDSDELTLEQLEEVLKETNEKHNRIRARQEMLKEERKHGVRSDPDWVRRMILAARKIADQRTFLLKEVADCKKAIRRRESEQEQLPVHFVQVAKRYLPEETFNRLMQMATERYQQTQPEKKKEEGA